MATRTNESVIAGPAPGRPNCEAAWDPCRIKSITVGFEYRLDRDMALPAAAVPVRVKMPLPITAPMPSAVRLQGPASCEDSSAGLRTPQSARRCSSCGRVGSSIGLLAVDCRGGGGPRRLSTVAILALPLALRLMPNSSSSCEPRATPAARLAFGAAFLRAARFDFFAFRSCR